MYRTGACEEWRCTGAKEGSSSHLRAHICAHFYSTNRQIQFYTIGLPSTLVQGVRQA